MRTTLLGLLLFFVFTLSAQNEKNERVTWKTWSLPSNSAVSKASIKGYGPLSDTLSSLHNGVEVYLVDDAYYKITSVADYYYWFTRKHPELFNNSIEVYENLFAQGDDLNMCKFISSNYLGKELPVKFKKYHNNSNLQSQYQMTYLNPSEPFNFRKEFGNQMNYHIVTNTSPVPNIPVSNPPKIDNGTTVQQ